MLLDLGLPKQDGLRVLGEIRRASVKLPVIVVTARGGTDDIVTGLDSGADDYLAKPFRLAELLARVRARLRTPAAPEATTLVNGDISLDLRARQARVSGLVIDLSAREFALAETFFRHPGQVLSREQLLSRVWGYDYDPGSNVVDVYVRYLRNKLGSDRIATIRGAARLPAGQGCLVASRRAAETPASPSRPCGSRPRRPVVLVLRNAADGPCPGIRPGRIPGHGGEGEAAYSSPLSSPRSSRWSFLPCSCPRLSLSSCSRSKPLPTCSTRAMTVISSLSCALTSTLPRLARCGPCCMSLLSPPAMSRP